LNRLLSHLTTTRLAISPHHLLWKLTQFSHPLKAVTCKPDTNHSISELSSESQSHTAAIKAIDELYMERLKTIDPELQKQQVKASEKVKVSDTQQLMTQLVEETAKKCAALQAASTLQGLKASGGPKLDNDDDDDGWFIGNYTNSLLDPETHAANSSYSKEQLVRLFQNSEPALNSKGETARESSLQSIS
jgi:hypothetical protein